MTCQNPKISKENPALLDRGIEQEMTIRIKKNECQKYLFVPEKSGTYERVIYVEEGAVFRGASISIGADMVLKVSVFIEGSQSEASLRLLGLATDGTQISLDGIGNVAPGCTHVKLRIDQANILLGHNVSIRGRPVLNIATDSIEGGHSCTVHRISGESLFYLQSHGLDEKTAESLLLEGEIGKCTELLGEEGEKVKEEVVAKIHKTSIPNNKH